MNTVAIDRSTRQTVAAWLRRMLIVVALAVTVLNVQAGVVFTTLHGFGVFTNGEEPRAGLVQGSDGSFYGTTLQGGTSGFGGTVFKISTNGVLTPLYSFTGGNDGSGPAASLVQGSDGNFYGTTLGGGTNGDGTVFKISTNGVLTPLHSFTGGVDGANPYAGLVQGSDGNFYGTTYIGGTSENGTVFKISTNGVLTPLYSFGDGNDGAAPMSSLVQGNDGNFYGTAQDGGAYGVGAVFKISTNGVLTPLYSFTGGVDGGNPEAGLVQGSDGNFYGTTLEGGTNGAGAVFEISTNGVFTPLYSFTYGNDGADPYSGLVQGSDGNFYGTTSSGGPYNAGAVFKINTHGVFTPLYSFTGGVDGAYPDAGLVQGRDGNFYGATVHGGTNGAGAVFEISTNGVLTPLYSFGDGNDGEYPYAGLVQGSDGNFYGTTYEGGTNNYGDVFKISTNGVLTSLYSFTGGDDGEFPYALLVQGSDGNFYGTTYEGGTYGDGAVFEISSNGKFTSLYSFTDGNDGANPVAGLAQGSDGNFYGTTLNGGTNGAGGTVFKISTNGEFTSLYSFTNGNDGVYPMAVLAQGSDGNFYGTAFEGGTYHDGTVFKISTIGEFTSLYSFTGGNDGAFPYAGLLQGSDGNFYGTAYDGGTNDVGTIFKISTNGAFTSLYSFTGGNDGVHPEAGLVQGSDGNFYGTTLYGGTYGVGAVFEIGTNGVSTSLYSFTGLNDGAYPDAGLVQGSDGNFYGTTTVGGVGGYGTVFSISVGLGPISPIPAPVSIITTNSAFGFINEAFGFDLVGPSGSNVVIEASTNLRTWIPLLTNLFGGGPLYFPTRSLPPTVSGFTGLWCRPEMSTVPLAKRCKSLDNQYRDDM